MKPIEDGPVLLDLDADGVAWLRLNRPDTANAMNVELLQALHGALLACGGDRAVRVVVLSGNGANFCAGGDVRTFAAQGADLPAYIQEATAWLQIVTSALIRLPAPVVTSVQGFAAGGGGLGLVCASDLVLAAESARFLAGATRVGMAPDGGATVTLTQLVGFRRAMEIVLTNRVVTAAEAAEIGLITRAVPDDALHEETATLARTLAAGAPKAFAATKRLMWDGLGAAVESRLAEEARTVTELSGSADATEGLAAVIERRKPRFRGE